MPRHVVFLTEPSEVRTLKKMASDLSTAPPITIVSTLQELLACPALKVPGTRLIAFCSSVIVPKAVLDGLDGPAYNFHPGPPEIPGLYPSIWAIYHGHTKYGVTAHVMYPKVDTGPIVGLDRCDLPQGLGRLQVDIMARDMVYGLFMRLREALLCGDAPLAHLPVDWGKRYYTRRDFNDLCQIAPDITRPEFDLRLRALGEGPEHALTVRLYDRLFALQPESGEKIISRAGVTIDGSKEKL